MESQIWCYGVVALCGGRLRKGTMATVCSSLWENAVPQLSTWCQTLWFLPTCHWCPSRCCPGAGAQRKWVWVSPRAGPSKRRCLKILQFLLPAQPPLVFTARSMGISLSGSETLGWDPSFMIYPSKLIHHTWVGDQPTLCFCSSTPLTHLYECGFFNSLVVRPPYRLIF